MAITIKEVTDNSTLRKFVKFNLDLYKDCPYHVPTLINDEIMTLSRDKNPAFEFCEAVYYLAYKDGKIVGRIAGIINPRANERWEQNYARFGFVDFIDDKEVVDALFQAVENWAKERGKVAMHGPLGFTDLDHEGLLVDGFDNLGTMNTYYSYPYYKDHLERLGYVKDQDWQEFQIQIPKEVPEKHRRIAEIVKKKYGLKVLKFKKTKEVWPYAQRIFELWNEAFYPLYGYSRLTPAQIDYYVKMYIPMIRLDLVTLIVREEDDEVIGLGIALPNLSKAMRAAKGRLFPFGWIGLLKSMYGSNKVVDLYLIGVHPDYQSKGVNAPIIVEMIDSFIKFGFEYGESNPELELNHKVQSQWDDFDSKLVRTRRAFIKELTPNK
ncbi:hypothetical protein LJB84_01625 [Bacteroidales bacterium OttesenSCG-928-J19]|nr:hypothetical protein [Bacteroidales bacterium OttesenSCG-928-J19]